MSRSFQPVDGHYGYGQQDFLSSLTPEDLEPHNLERALGAFLGSTEEDSTLERELSLEQTIFNTDDFSTTQQQCSPQSRRYNSSPIEGLNEQRVDLQGLSSPFQAGGALQRMDFDEGVSTLTDWRPVHHPRQKSFTSPVRARISPFSASTVQSVQIPAWQPNASLGFEEVAPADLSFGKRSSMESRVSYSPQLSYGSAALPPRQPPNQDVRCNSYAMGDHPISDLARGPQTGTLTMFHDSEDARTPALRAMSSPVCGLDLAAIEFSRPSKRSRKSLGGSHTALSNSGSALSPARITFSPRLSANSIRIVSGKGEYDCPAPRRVAEEKPKARARYFTVRTNELNKRSSSGPSHDISEARSGPGSRFNGYVSRRTISGESELGTAASFSFGPLADCPAYAELPGLDELRM